MHRYRPSRGLSRRDLFQNGIVAPFVATLAWRWFEAEVRAEARTQDIPRSSIPPLNRFPRMVQEAYVDRVHGIERERIRRLNALGSKADAEAYVRSVRERIREAFGPCPERTPLNPRTTGVVERDAYTIEKILFESRPDFLVSANLYVPKGRDLPRPGVVGTCGHSANGKAAEPYQAFAQGLARQGYVVLIFDPIGQGERFQYPGDDLTSTVGPGVSEHLQAGNQQTLVGESLAAWRAWDGIRALDYLLTREEVDPKRVGVTGNSGGGTMTTWLAGVDDRWSVAAPSCFVTTFRRNLENELPADIEQCPPRVLALGLDHADFLAAMAPRPVIILAKEKDYFDVRGARQAYEQLRRIYRLLDAEDQIGFFAGPTGHGYSQENREAMYGWFNRVSGTSNASSEPPLTIEADETLWCTPQGQVAPLNSKSIIAFTRELSEHLTRERDATPRARRLERLAARIDPEPNRRPPDYRILRPSRGRDYPKRFAATYVVNTDPGIQAIVTRLYDEAHLSRPPGDPPHAVLYVAHQSADAELRDEPLIREILDSEPDAAFYACDVRGIGESRPDTCGTDAYRDPYGADYFYAAHGLMLDDPYPIQRTRDLLHVLDWLRAAGHREVHLTANGWGTIPGTLAAWRHDLVTSVTLRHAPTSFSAVAEAQGYAWPLSAFLPDLLKTADFPDIYEDLAREKSLRQVEPWGPNMSPG